MKMHRNQTGASHVVAVLVVVLVAVISFAGYRVMQASKDTASTPTNSTVATTEPAKIQSKADVTATTKALDSDTSDANLDPSQLDGDLNSLL